MTVKRHTIVGLAIAVCVIVLAYCVFRSESPAPTGPDRMRVGYLAIANSLPLYVAVADGLFAANGLDVRLEEYKTSNDLVEALVAGRIDLQVSASSAVLFNFESKQPGLFAAFSANVQTQAHYPDMVLVRTDSDITSMTDLAGTRMATFPGSTFLAITKIVLRAYIDPGTVTLEQVPPPSQMEALAAGQVDALYTMEPFCTMATERGIARVLLPAAAEKHVCDPLVGGLSTFSRKTALARAVAAEAFSEAYDAAIGVVRTEERRARSIMPKFMPITEEMAQKVRLVGVWKHGELDLGVVRTYAEALAAEGELASVPDMNGLKW